MGKQNFIQGGFKGKVGNVIGAGWKDILTIRSYTKPANPKTERQKTVRNAFALKVKASQLANQCNYGSSLFSSTSNTSWGLRMAAASSFYAENKNIIQFVPLIPYGYTPDYPTDADPQTAGGTVVLSWNTADDISGRSVNVLIWALTNDGITYDAVIIAGTVAGSSGAWTVTVSLPAGYSIGEDSYLAAVSSDDANYSDTTLYQPPVSIGTSIVNVPFTMSLASGPTWTSGNDYVLFTFTPSETLSDGANISASSSAYGVLQGDFVTDADTAAVQVISNVVTVAVPITLDSLGQRPLFVSGSSVTLGSFSYVADGYRYQFAGATYSLAEVATVQTLLIDTQTFTLQNGEFKALIKSTDAQATGIADGEYSVKSVNLTSLSTETKTGDMYVSQSNGNIYISLDGLTALYWGANSSVTIVTTPQVRINGVPYTPNFTAPVCVPTATKTTTTLSSAQSSSSIWVQLSNKVDLYVDIDVGGGGTYNTIGLDGTYPTVTFSQSGTQYTFTGENINYEIEESRSYVSFAFSNSDTFDDGTSANWNVDFSPAVVVGYTLENTDGFRSEFTFDTFTKSFSGQSS